MNHEDYLCNSLAVMLMNGMSNHIVKFSYDEKENTNYDKVYDRERSNRINRLMQEAFDQCIKDYEIFAMSDEKLDDLDEFCNRMVDSDYDNIVEQAEKEVRALGIKRYFINAFDIIAKDKYTHVYLEFYYHDIDDYWNVDRYDITRFNMNSEFSDQGDYNHFWYWNEYWQLSYHGPELKVFL